MYIYNQNNFALKNSLTEKVSFLTLFQGENQNLILKSHKYFRRKLFSFKHKLHFRRNSLFKLVFGQKTTFLIPVQRGRGVSITDHRGRKVVDHRNAGVEEKKKEKLKKEKI